MDIQRKDAGKKRLIRRIVIGIVLVAAVGGTTVVVSRLEAGGALGGSVRGLAGYREARPMTREVRGLGTLVPEETMLIPATTEGRVQRILIRPGTPVKANSVVMILTSQELETDLLNAEYAMKAAEADYANLKVTLEKLNLDMQSTVAQVGADYNTAKLQGDRDAALAKEGPVQRGGRQDFGGEGASNWAAACNWNRSGFPSTRRAEEAQLAAAKVKVDQLRGQFNLKKSQVDQLNVRAGFDGVLQQLPDAGGSGPEGGRRHAARERWRRPPS